MDPQPVVMDCDPGHDDFLAILLAQHFTDLRGITTVAGNASIDDTTRNACIAAEMCGFRGPVVRGSSGPLVGEPRFADDIHGTSGLAGPTLPPVTRSADPGDGSSFLLDVCRTDTWVVATGPLTNVALAIRRDPGFASRIAGISIMGGSTSFGNKSPAAEFNIWSDPEAASIVFTSGADIRMLGLNVTHTVLVDGRFVKCVNGLESRSAKFVAELLQEFLNAHNRVYKQGNVAPLHDPCAVLAVSHPGLFEFVPSHVDIELAGTFTRGMTVVDQRGMRNAAATNAKVAMRADGPHCMELLFETVSTL